MIFMNYATHYKTTHSITGMLMSMHD